MESIILGGVLAFGMAAGQSAQAAPPDCSMDKWTGGNTLSANAVGSPQSVTPVARYSEYCGLAVSNSDTGYVTTPATSDTHYFGRFYVLLGASGGTEVDLLVAYDNSDNPLYTISYNGTSFIFDAENGGSGSAPAVANKWNLVEFEFNSGGNSNVWVNESWDFVGAAYGNTTIAPFSSGTGTVAYVRLGAPNGMGGFTGKFTFDAYEAHRTTNVGSLIDCDADGSGSTTLNLNDVIAVISEAFAPNTLANGQPDCDKNGAMNLNDVISTIEIAFP